MSAPMRALARRFARYAARLAFSDLGPSTVHEAKRRILDSLACAMGGWRSEPASIARRVAAAGSDPRGATLLGTGFRVPPDMAAFANGAAIRYLDYNDTYLSLEPAHPSDNLAATLAAAEAAGRSGRDLILATVLAYEAQCRLCDAASLRARGWDHVTYGSFSSTLGAGILLGLSEAALVHAQGLAAVCSCAMRQTRVGELSMWKACAFSVVARGGVLAARLAKAGMTGPAPIFEGSMGFERQVSGPMRPVRLTRPGGTFMLDRTYIKRWPAEYHSQSAIDAALEILAKGPAGLRRRLADPAFVKGIEIDSHDAAVDIIGSEPEKWDPRSKETADHSLPYITVSALLDGGVTERTFEPRRFRDPGRLGIVRRVKVRRDREFSRGYGESFGNRVTVRTAAGTFRAEVLHPKGHPRNPMADAEIEAKFRRLSDGLLSPRAQDRAIQAVWDLDRMRDVRALPPRLRIR